MLEPELRPGDGLAPAATPGEPEGRDAAEGGQRSSQEPPQLAARRARPPSTLPGPPSRRCSRPRRSSGRWPRRRPRSARRRLAGRRARGCRRVVEVARDHDPVANVPPGSSPRPGGTASASRTTTPGGMSDVDRHERPAGASGTSRAPTRTCRSSRPSRIADVRREPQRPVAVALQRGVRHQHGIRLVLPDRGPASSPASESSSLSRTSPPAWHGSSRQPRGRGGGWALRRSGRCDQQRDPDTTKMLWQIAMACERLGATPGSPVRRHIGCRRIVEVARDDDPVPDVPRLQIAERRRDGSATSGVRPGGNSAATDTNRPIAAPDRAGSARTSAPSRPRPDPGRTP